jgi:hypothetical protein
VEYVEQSGWDIVDTLLAERGSHRYEVTFQLSTWARAVAIEENEAVVTLDNGSQVTFGFKRSVGLSLSKETGWVSETWNQKQEAPRLVVTARSELREVEIQTTIRSRV